MTIDANEYKRLKSRVEQLQREHDRAQGSLDRLMQQLKDEHGVATLDAARKLAKSLGTSVRMIDQTYDDFQTEAEMDELTRRAGIAEIGKVKWDENGYPILRG